MPVALVTVSVAGGATDVERSERASAVGAVFIVFALVVAGGPFFNRLIPWPRMSGVFGLVLFSGRFGALASFFCRSAFSARSRSTSASDAEIASDGVAATEPVVGWLSVRIVIGGRKSAPSWSALELGSIDGNGRKAPDCENCASPCCPRKVSYASRSRVSFVHF